MAESAQDDHAGVDPWVCREYAGVREFRGRMGIVTGWRSNSFMVRTKFTVWELSNSLKKHLQLYLNRIGHDEYWAGSGSARKCFAMPID